MIKTELPVRPNNSYIASQGNEKWEENGSILRGKKMYNLVLEALRELQ